MKIQNFDIASKKKSSHKQIHPAMPDDTFRMLICGPSNSGKTNVLLHMIYNLLHFDEIVLFAKNLHQDKYQWMLDDFEKRVDPAVGNQLMFMLLQMVVSV